MMTAQSSRFRSLSGPPVAQSDRRTDDKRLLDAATPRLLFRERERAIRV
jgi:hypothetical protein